MKLRRSSNINTEAALSDNYPSNIKKEILLKENSQKESLQREQSLKYKSVKEIVNEVVSYATNQKNIAQLNYIDKDITTKQSYLEDIKSYVHNEYLLEDSETEAQVMEEFRRFMWSYYILDELIDDPDISDIRIVAYNQIYIKKKGVRQISDIQFADEKDYERFVERVAIKNKINLSDQNAIQTFTDKSQPGWRLRFNISTRFITNTGCSYIHIRKHPAKKKTISELILDGMLTKAQADYLIGKIWDGESILFCGSGGSGKTTLLNALLEYIPNRSVFCIQESDELFMEKQCEFMNYHVVSNKGEGKINYSLADLAPHGLLTDIDIFIIGEIKGAEALDFLIAVHTGATGYGSVHAPSEKDAFIRLADYIKKVSDYSIDEIMFMLRYLKTIVFMKGYKVASISSSGWNDDNNELEVTRVM